MTGPSARGWFARQRTERTRREPWQVANRARRTNAATDTRATSLRPDADNHGEPVAVDKDRPSGGGPYAVRPSLPAATTDRDEPGPERRNESFPGPPDLSNLRVLVVDDEADARELLEFVLTRFRADVHTAASAAEALAILDTFVPDVLLSDISMPGMDGFEFIASVRRRSPERGGDVPAVAVTACARAEDRTRALDSGFQRHVPKPVDALEILGVVASLAAPPR